LARFSIVTARSPHPSKVCKVFIAGSLDLD
jgi:hypothetical protein